MPRKSKLSEELNSSILSIGTEDLGLTISSANMEKMTNVQNGGFFGLFSDKMARLALEACKKGEFQVVIYFIQENLITDFSEVMPDTGFTILHYLVAYYNMIYSVDTRIESVIKKVLARDDVKSFINKQDITNGNTPLHLAVMSKNFELASQLINAGADTKIKNNNEMFVGTDSETDVMKEVDRQSKVSNLTEIRNNFNNSDLDTNSDIFIKTPSKNKTQDVSSNDKVKDMVNALFKMENKGNTENTISASDLPSSLGKTVTENNTKTGSEYLANIQDTDRFLDAMIKNYSKEPTESAQKGGRIKGSRKMTSNYSSNSRKTELSESMYGLTLSGGSELSDKSELSRMIENQADKTHKRVVEKIREILGVDDITARAYKALIYAKIKSEKPELNNYDRAVEMEKLTTREVLNSFEKTKLNEIKEHITKKDKERSESPKTSEESEESVKEKKVKKTKKGTVEETESKKTKKTKTTKMSRSMSVNTDTSDMSITSSEIVSSSKSNKLRESQFSATSRYSNSIDSINLFMTSD